VIVVLVPHLKPLEVLRMTRHDLVMRVRQLGETGQYLATLPPGRTIGEFEQAWARYTRDMKCARHFESLEEAREFYAGSRDGLTIVEHSRVIHALHQLDATAPWAVDHLPGAGSDAA
jgi:hypothetical protein